MKIDLQTNEHLDLSRRGAHLLNLDEIKPAELVENNAALVSGHCSDIGHIKYGCLFAMTIPGNLQPLYDDYNNIFVKEEFPIGAALYVYMGSEILTDVDVKNLQAYSSHRDVLLSVYNIDYQDAYDNFDYYGGVWLEVGLNMTHTAWYPIALVGTKGMHAKGLYIYLGGYTGTNTGSAQDDYDHFMLEQQNGLYFYDNGKLTEFGLWELNSQVGWIEAQLADI